MAKLPQKGEIYSSTFLILAPQLVIKLHMIYLDKVKILTDLMTARNTVSFVPDTDKRSTLYVASFVCICVPSEITMYETHTFMDESAMQLCDTNDICIAFKLYRW